MKKVALAVLVGTMGIVAAVGLKAGATDGDHEKFHFAPDSLVLTRSVYLGAADTVTSGETLPLGCAGGPNGTTTVNVPLIAGGTTPVIVTCGVASDNGEFPNLNDSHNVWNNAATDGSFGITSPIFLDQLSPTGTVINTLAVPPNLLTTSFPSKSELAVHLSSDGTALTLVGYAAPPNTIDVSNSNAPTVYDPTNPAGGSYFRAVLQIGANGALQVTPTNAYSGNNGRAALLANGLYYLAGNDNNGSGTPPNIVTSTGVELATPGQAYQS